MSDRYWPKDVLGNDIRKGAMVMIGSGAPMLMKVVDVVEAGVMPQADENKPPMIMQGHIALLVQLPYHPQQTTIPIAVVAKEPVESLIHRA